MEILGNTFLVVAVTIQILTYFWFITLALIGFCIYFGSLQRNIAANPSAKFLQLAPFALTLSIIACGGFFYADNFNNKFYPWADAVIYALLFLQVLISGMSIWQAKNRVGFVVALSAFQLWLSLSSGFVSLMSVTNTWL